MKMVPTSAEKINEYSCVMKKSKWLAYLDEFIASPYAEMEVVDDLHEYKNSTAIYNSVRGAIQRFGYRVQVTCRKSHVFLLKPESALYFE